MMHNLANSSSWKRLLYKIGFKVPSNAFAKADYAEYLATLNEVPSGTAGIDPGSFFAWLKATGRIKDYAQVTNLSIENVHAEMISMDGVLLTLNLTQRSYNQAFSKEPWTLENGETPDPLLGHAVADVSYDATDDGVVTWGIVKSMSRAYFEACVTGCWVFN
jgi:hypothetical protein